MFVSWSTLAFFYYSWKQTVRALASLNKTLLLLRVHGDLKLNSAPVFVFSFVLFMGSQISGILLNAVLISFLHSWNLFFFWFWNKNIPNSCSKDELLVWLSWQKIIAFFTSLPYFPHYKLHCIISRIGNFWLVFLGKFIDKSHWTISHAEL